jgi:hypothetical protein
MDGDIPKAPVSRPPETRETIRMAEGRPLPPPNQKIRAEPHAGIVVIVAVAIYVFINAARDTVDLFARFWN